MKVTVYASDTDAWIDEFGAAHAGLISAAAARDAGITEKALRHRVATGRLVVAGSGVWRLRSHRMTWDGRLWAACFDAGPGAVACLRSAARLHGLWRYRAADEIEVMVKRGGNHQCTVGRLVETSLLDPCDVVVIAGFPCTSLARTVFDLIGDPDHGPLRTESARRFQKQRMLEVVNDAMRHHGLTVLVELLLVASIGRRGRRGTAMTREIFKELGVDYVPDESQVESVFSTLWPRSGLPTPIKQLVISDAKGFIGRVDFAWPELRLVVEIDSSFHDGPLDRRNDADRDARLHALGYLVLRFRWHDLVSEPDRVLRELRRARRRREQAVISAPSGAEITAHS